MQKELNRVFDLFTDARPTRPANGNGVFIPVAELEETPEGFNLRLEIPGIDPDNLNIEATAEAVAIRGERKSELKVEEKGMVRSEFRYGQFQRLIPLPARIQNDAVVADYKDGVLHLTLPKAEEEKNKVVKVALTADDAS
ncbi:MAG: Hsp20/alpha crystallin family protein [Cyanobacteria bacterium J06641_5]